MSDPFRGILPQDVPVRVAVAICGDGYFFAYGRAGADDEELVRETLEGLDRYSRSDLRHVKFLQITLQTPDTLAVNLEAQLRENVHPRTTVEDGPVVREDD